VNDDRLYRALDALLPKKVELEKHLKSRLGELFSLEYDLLLYDVTSAYFEGECSASPASAAPLALHSPKHRNALVYVAKCLTNAPTNPGIVYSSGSTCTSRPRSRAVCEVMGPMEAMTGPVISPG